MKDNLDNDDIEQNTQGNGKALATTTSTGLHVSRRRKKYEKNLVWNNKDKHKCKRKSLWFVDIRNDTMTNAEIVGKYRASLEAKDSLKYTEKAVRLNFHQMAG